jgi:cholesterol transport system auxiliary component
LKPLIRVPLRPRAVLAVSALATAIALSGCISLLPKSKPAQLYRFGATTQEATAPAPSANTFGVLKPPAAFQREAAADRIMTINGTQVAYVSAARWVTPANVLFDEAVTQAFAADNGPARLQSRGDPRKADYTLRLMVRTFEARYTHGPKSAPDITVTIDAALARNDRTVARETTFTTTVQAGDNRVGPIVDAFNHSLDKLLPQLTQWVDAAGPVPER